MIFLKKQQIKEIKYASQYALALVFFLVIKPFSFKNKRFIAGIIGKIILYPYLKYIEKKRFAILKKNLTIITKKIHTNKQYSTLLKKYCTYVARTFLTTIHHDCITKEWLEENIKENGFDEVIKAHKNGEKVIIASAHFGNWEIARDYFLKVHHLPLTVMYREQNNVRLSKLFYGNHGNVKMIEKRDKSALKQMMKSIAEGRIVVILLDQKDIHNGTPIEFFGEEAFLPTAMSRIIIKNECKVFVCHCTAQNFTVNCDSSINEKPFTNEIDLTREIFKIFEKWIVENPINWYCLTHDIWKK